MSEDPTETELRLALPDAARFARVGAVAVAVAWRRDGLLHARALDPARGADEMIGLPDLASRPPRGFWSDPVAAAVAAVPPEHGVEVVVAAPADIPLAGSADLLVASFLALCDDSTVADEARFGACIRAAAVGAFAEAEISCSLSARRGRVCYPTS